MVGKDSLLIQAPYPVLDKAMPVTRNRLRQGLLKRECNGLEGS
jgi:hypothetical protein